MVPGSVFGNMDYFQGLVVILDTYSNHNGPHNVSCCNECHTYNFIRFCVCRVVFQPVRLGTLLSGT
jgi:hypothetical protein